MKLTDQTSRRDAIKIGGVTLSLGAFLAACGNDRGGPDEAGRVGNAPEVEPLPSYQVDDAVLLRTASSLEYTAVAVYEAVLGLDALPASMTPLLERLVAEHQGVADEMVALTEAAGGEAWTCPNDWFMERLVGPVVAAIQEPFMGTILDDEGDGMIQIGGEVLPVSDDSIMTVRGRVDVLDSVDVDESGRVVGLDGAEVKPGDQVRFTRIEGDVQRDLLAVANALESFATASHQALASAISAGNVDARVAHARAAALEARHAAAISIATSGADGYISPTLVGEEAGAAEDGQIRQFAVPSAFGLTSQIEIKAGPADLNGVRTSFVLQTPADNSFVYNELSCSA